MTLAVDAQLGDRAPTDRAPATDRQRSRRRRGQGRQGRYGAVAVTSRPDDAGHLAWPVGVRPSRDINRSRQQAEPPG